MKEQSPADGRRKWHLRVLYNLWPTIDCDQLLEDIDNDLSVCSYCQYLLLYAFDLRSLKFDDPDPFDYLTDDNQLGLIIRTDFSNEEAWSAFCNQVQVSQKDLVSDLTNNSPDQEPASNPEGNDIQKATSDEADDSESDSSNEPPDFLKILNPVEQSDRIRFTDISNLRALRLFNDVDIRPTPERPVGTKPISPSCPLIDLLGWQEIYSGKNLWIYDTLSNVDGNVRVVSQTSDFYGTATYVFLSIIIIRSTTNLIEQWR